MPIANTVSPPDNPAHVESEVDWKERRCVVTGGLGFIGSHLVDELLRRGASVRVVDNLSRGTPDNLNQTQGEVEFIRGDLTDPQVAFQALSDASVCFHVAARVSGVQLMNHPDMLENAVIDRNVMEACRRRGTQHVLYTSTACTYPVHMQEGPGALLSEEDVLRYGAQPDSVYGWCKLLGEIMCKTYHETYGMQIAVVRPFNPYGPRDYFDLDTSHVIPALIRRAIDRENPLVVWGDGEQSRAFQYVTDVAKGFLLALDAITDATAINLGTSDGMKIKNLARLILRLTGNPDTAISFEKEMPQGVRARRASSAKALELLGWKAEVSLEEGLKNTIKWYLNRDGKSAQIHPSPC